MTFKNYFDSIVNENVEKMQVLKGGNNVGYIYDYSKLKGRIVEKLGSFCNFAKKMDLSENTVYHKLGNKIDFRQSEILKACLILDIQHREIPQYFFCITN